MGQRWLAGLVFKEQRRLTTAERREFDAILSRLAAARLGGLPGVICLMLLAFAGLSSGSEAAALVSVLALVGTVPLGLWWIEGAKFHGRLKQDLPEPLLDRFVREQVESQGQGTAGVQAAVVEVLSRSGAVWTEDGQRRSPLRLAAVTDTATVPDRSGIVAGWMQTQELNPDEPTHRELSDEERSEIRGYLRAILVRVTWTTLLGIYGSAVVLRLLAESLIGQYQAYIACVIGAAILLSSLLRRDVRIGLNLRTDAAIGYVVVFPSAESDAPTGVVEGDILEVLPSTGMLWNVNAKPALWRRG